MTPRLSTICDSGQLSLPALVVHGGAGTFERMRDDSEATALHEGLAASLEAGWKAFDSGGSALDAVVEAVAALEDSGRFNAGRGAVPTSAGTVEMDASVMDDSSGLVGAICAATYPANPIRVARAVAEAGGLPTGPMLLAGDGADRFAARAGFEEMKGAWLTALRAAPPMQRSSSGTVGAVAVDSNGAVAAATSTGGRSGQVPGRVGDTPIPGAGVLAHDGLAVSATGEGEVFVVVGFAHRVAWQVAAGLSLEAAIEDALAQVAGYKGEGGAIALEGTGRFAASFSSQAMARGWRDSSGTTTRIFRPEASR